jgi:hypothetical protein
LEGSGIIFERISQFSSVISMLMLRMSDHGVEVMRLPLAFLTICLCLRVFFATTLALSAQSAKPALKFFGMFQEINDTLQ